jgi:SAM-dependent methyltransferase
MPGYGALCDLRSFFPESEYIGCDIREGLGVDRIEDAESLTFADATAGTVLLLEILEHLPHPEKALAEAHRVLREDGLLIVSVPFECRLHGFPSDYWRFTASGIHTLLSGFPEKVIFSLGPEAKPAFIFAVAGKAASARFTKGKGRFEPLVRETFAKTQLRGRISVLKERGRDFLGLLLGRAKLSVAFFDTKAPGGYYRAR